MHQTQIHIITDLAFVNSARYSELKPLEMEGSQFTYHLEELKKDDLIIKNEDGSYSLSLKGKQRANTLDVKVAKVIKRQIVSTIITAIKKIDGESNYLLYTRKRNPWMNCQSFITSRVRYEESSLAAASRGLLEQTGLIGTPELFHTFHSVVYTKNNELAEDLFLFAYVFKDVEGELKTSEIGDIEWIPESQIKEYAKRPNFKFFEILQKLKEYKDTPGYTEFNGISEYY